MHMSSLFDEPMTVTRSDVPRPRRLPVRLSEAVVGWLRQVPIADPVQRRNAAMLQVVLAFMGVLQPLSLLWARLGTGTFAGGSFALTLAALNTLLAWVCFLLVRRGRYAPAAHAFIAGTLLLLGIVYARWGLDLQLRFQVSQVYPVLIAGLLLHRRALWWSLAALCLVVLLGAWRDVSALGFDALAMDRAIDNTWRSLFALLVIAVILDRAVTAFRESLEAANRRGNELARMRDLLQLEMQARERSREQLIHAQKVEAVGRLASGVAHDFGNLLSLILGYAGKGRRSDDPDTLKQALAGVDSAARRANAVSQKLLSFSRQDDTRLECFDPAQALQEMKPMLRQLFDAAIGLELELPADPLVIRFDRTQFELVVLNLAANANHAMPVGGSFRVCLQADAEAEQVVIAFSDTGTGMAPDIQARIFEPFFTTKPVGQGTGLGLAVARDLVEQAGGSLTVRSAPGAGTTFRIAVPRQP
jgi:signal transduction histidine kinase